MKRLSVTSVISTLIHAALVAAPAALWSSTRELRRDLQVMYYQQPTLASSKALVSATATAPSLPAAPEQAARDRGGLTPELPQTLMEAPGEASGPTGPVTERPQSPDTIDLSDLTQLPSDSVAFVDYFRLLRERIRAAALHRLPDRLTEGEVFLNFTVNADGRITGAHVVEGRSSSQPGLRAASLDSLREAGPFPPFPKTLQREAITFNIIISYELGETR